MSTTSLIDLPIVAASAVDPDLAHLPGNDLSPSSALRNAGTQQIPTTLPLTGLNSQGTSEGSTKYNMSQLQIARLHLQMQEVGTLGDLNKSFNMILHAITHAATLNTGQDTLVEAGALLRDHYTIEYLSNLLDHTLQTESCRPGLLHLWLHRRLKHYDEPCPDGSFPQPLPPPARSAVHPVSEYALSVAGSHSSTRDSDTASVAHFFEDLVSPPADSSAENASAERVPADHVSSSHAEAGSLQHFLSDIRTLSLDGKAEQFTAYVISPAWYSPDRTVGHPSSTRRNLSLEAVLDVVPVSSAEVLANPRKPSTAMLGIINAVLKDPSLYRQQRFTIYQELIYRYVQVYCLSRAQGQAHDGALRRAHASVHAFIVPVFDSIPLTHALVQTVLSTPGLSSEQQLTKILIAFDMKLRPTLDALSSTFDSLVIVLGETFLQLHGRAMSLQVDNETVISDVAFYNKLYTLLRQAATTSSVARDVLNTFVGPHYKHAPAQDLYDGMQEFTFCKLPLLRAGAAADAGGLEGTFLSGDASPVVQTGGGKRQKPKIVAVNLAVTQKHLVLGRRAEVGHVPCPKVINGETCCWFCFDLDTKVIKWFQNAPANPRGTRFHHNPWRCPDQDAWWAKYSKANPNDKREDVMPVIDNEFEVYAACCRSAGIEPLAT